jgi:hypothetical protein
VPQIPAPVTFRSTSPGPGEGALMVSTRAIPASCKRSARIVKLISRTRRPD